MHLCLFFGAATGASLRNQEYETLDDLLAVPCERVENILEKCGLKSKTVQSLLEFLDNKRQKQRNPPVILVKY
jgi:hypothetical protein